MKKIYKINKPCIFGVKMVRATERIMHSVMNISVKIIKKYKGSRKQSSSTNGQAIKALLSSPLELNSQWNFFVGLQKC